MFAYLKTFIALNMYLTVYLFTKNVYMIFLVSVSCLGKTHWPLKFDNWNEDSPHRIYRKKTFVFLNIDNSGCDLKINWHFRTTVDLDRIDQDWLMDRV